MLMIFTITKGEEGMHLRGHYDGNEFIPNLGYCSSIDELYEYDRLEIYTVEGMTCSMPKKFYNNLEEDFKREYIRILGEIEQEKQLSLF